MINLWWKIRRSLGKFFKKLGNNIYYEPEFSNISFPEIKTVYVPDKMDRISVKRTFTHHGRELIIPYEELEEEEARALAIDISKKLIPYIKNDEGMFGDISVKELIVYVDKNGED